MTLKEVALCLNRLYWTHPEWWNLPVTVRGMPVIGTDVVEVDGKIDILLVPPETNAELVKERPSRRIQMDGPGDLEGRG